MPAFDSVQVANIVDHVRDEYEDEAVKQAKFAAIRLEAKDLAIASLKLDARRADVEIASLRQDLFEARNESTARRVRAWFIRG